MGQISSFFCSEERERVLTKASRARPCFCIFNQRRDAGHSQRRVHSQGMIRRFPAWQIAHVNRQQRNTCCLDGRLERGNTTNAVRTPCACQNGSRSRLRRSQVTWCREGGCRVSGMQYLFTCENHKTRFGSGQKSLEAGVSRLDIERHFGEGFN